MATDDTLRIVKPKFHYADFPVTSATNPLRRLPRNFSGRGSFEEVGVMEFGLKETSRVCRGRHGEVGIVEFGLKRVPDQFA